MAAQGLRVLRCIDREYLLQQISGRPVGHNGGEMRLNPVEFRCRPFEQIEAAGVARTDETLGFDS
jgi:hypothetical protein